VRKIILLDLANVFFRAFFAVPQKMPNNAVFGTVGIIFSIWEKFKPDQIFAFRDCREKTFRHEKFKNYKAQRPPTPPNLVAQLPKIFQFFSELKIPLFAEPGFEADDLIATFCRNFCGDDREILIVSTDGDLQSLTTEKNVFVLRPAGGSEFQKMDADAVREKTGVAPEQIADLKALSGDAADNFPGIAGVGPKTAAQLLREFQTLQNLGKNLEKIPGRPGKLLRENFAVAQEFKKISELNFAAPLPDNILEIGKTAEFDFSSAKSFLENLKFWSLIRRVQKLENPKSETEIGKSAREKAVVNRETPQLSLF